MTTPSPPLDSFRARLRYARTLRGYSGAELAGLAGLSKTHVSVLETRPGNRVTLLTTKALAAALKVDHGWLVFGAGTPPKAAQEAG